ncbi:MAG: malonate decarboxylase holo-[acyl-carrier-protein] synthase [Rhodospirillaceae bacterium]
MRLVRHLLADFTPSARACLPERAVAGLLPPFRAPKVTARAAACLKDSILPGIVCRPWLPMQADEVQVGLSFPFREDGARVRSTFPVRRQEIAALTDPYRVAACAGGLGGAIGDAVRALIARGAACGIAVGLIGSVALEIATRLSYTSAASDIDLLIKGGDMVRYGRFAAGAVEIGRAFGFAVDAEVELADGGGVKLAELLSTSRSLLVKDLAEVRMVGRDEVLALL